MRVPPVATFALLFGAGVGWGISGAPWWSAPLAVVLASAAPIGPFRRPERALWILVAVVGAAIGRVEGGRGACPPPEPGVRAELSGRFLASPRSGAAPFEVDRRCGPVTVVTADTTLPAGVLLRLEGRWMAGRSRPWLRSERAVRAEADAGADRGGALRWAAVRWRDALARRAEALYGERAPLVTALVLARREGMDRELGDRFARIGIAHLLAISGFHVGVIAGAALALLRLLRLDRRRAALGAAAVAWAYVALIGAPDAACRAALILSLVAAGRVRGRPPARWGGLATAFAVLLVAEPGRLAQPGFQLSFAGAAGLVAWSGALGASVMRASGGRCPRALASALGAGVAATLATLPVVAWHFERVSVVGVPMTLAATPLVSIALPGALLSLLLTGPLAPLGMLLASGVDALLALLLVLTSAADGPWASLWTSRSAVVAGVVGCGVALAIARHPRIGARGRRGLSAAYVTVGLVLWPTAVGVAGLGRVEIVVIDVGQGDAIAVRSGRGAWLLVDAGPPGPDGDPGAHPVVRALRARGVTRLEALVLTHPDLDHIGGAVAVLSSVRVGAVYDPGVAVGKVEYLDVLRSAEARDVPWLAARAGQTIALPGAEVEILHPTEEAVATEETNETSVVLRVAYGAFDALLTGDAYKPTERRLAPELEGLEVLKVGHHGSDTSTDELLLEAAGPEVALISVGRFNRYGHPTPEVLARLERAGVVVHRTDLEGTLTVTAWRDGSFEVRGARE